MSTVFCIPSGLNSLSISCFLNLFESILSLDNAAELVAERKRQSEAEPLHRQCLSLPMVRARPISETGLDMDRLTPLHRRELVLFTEDREEVDAFDVKNIRPVIIVVHLSPKL